MNVIVLHNNNLPDFLLQRSKTSDIIIEPVSVELPKTDVPDIDTFISTILSNKNKVNSLCQYDVIVLPFNTTNNNLEYTGLRIAAHLRLTREWNCMSTPILFLGPDTFQEINQFSELGSLLNSFNVFISSKNKQEEIIDMLRWIKENTKAKDNIEDSPEYKDFLKRMKSISAPANYATHHSLANEWAIMRWNDMMTNPVDLPDKDFTKLLYYKYLRAIYGNSQDLEGCKNNNKNIEEIGDFRFGKKLALIDDEWEKGWANIIEHIANSSKFNFVYCPVKKEWDKPLLIRNVKSFIDENYKDTDCFLLDLRLHDEDFKESVNEKANLTGFDVMDYIKKKNKAIPVVVFSASNKIWNLQHVTANKTKGAIGYVLKETPESALKAHDSFILYKDFRKAIKTCFRLSDLKQIVEKQTELKNRYKEAISLDEFVNLVLLDKGANNNSLIKSCLLNLMTFLEEYLKERYTLITDEKTSITQLYRINGKKIGDVTCHVSVRFEDNNIKETNYTQDRERCRKPFTELMGKNLGIILPSLYLAYNISIDGVNQYFVPIRNARNEIAHTSNDISITFEQLYDFYFKIIVPVIEHDHK